MSKRIYVLDPGHGGVHPSTGKYVTPGKRSSIWPDGTIYYEGQGNREISKLVAKGLAQHGIEYLFTVSPENWEDVGLSARCKIANDIHRQSGHRAILISLHSNASDNASANGYEIFTSPGQTASDGIASIFLEELGHQFPELRNRGLKEEKFTVLTKSNCPAILLESMFHTNENECKILMSDAGKNRIADAIVSAILRIEQS